MSELIAVLGLMGLIGCYDLARRMSLRTRHGFRIAVIVVGLACVIAIMGEHESALITLLIGCGLYRWFSRREEGVHGRGNRVATGAVASERIEPARRTDEPSATDFDAGRSCQCVSSHRSDHDVNRMAA